MTDDNTTTLTGNDDSTDDADVDVPDDAGFYYCPDCGWDSDTGAPINSDMFNIGSTTDHIVECGNCGHSPLYVDLNDEDGYVEEPGFADMDTLTSDPADHDDLRGGDDGGDDA